MTNDSDNESLRIVSNLNGMPDSANGYFEDGDVDDTDEDLKFLMYVDAAIGQRYIVRYERNGSQPNDRAREPHRFTDLSLLRRESYLRHDHQTVDGKPICDITNVKNAAGDDKTEVSPGAAKFVVIAVGVTLPAVGTPNTDGYQPPSQVQLTSDVVLRNSIVY